MISVLVLTKNEEKVISACLASTDQLMGAEIIVVDNHSTDKTLEITKKYTKKIFQKEFDGYDKERNFVLTKASGDWIFYLDADERITSQLKEEIQKVIKDDKFSVFAVPRKNILLGKWQKHGGWWPDYQIRLFKRQALQGWIGGLHETPQFSGKLGYLKNPLIHLTHRDIISMMRKTKNWAPIEAKLRFDARHPKMTGWRFVRIVKGELLKQFLKGGWRNGTEGWIEIFYQTFSLFITYVKLWEMQRSESLDEAYSKIDKHLLKSNFEDDIHS